MIRPTEIAFKLHKKINHRALVDEKRQSTRNLVWIAYGGEGRLPDTTLGAFVRSDFLDVRKLRQRAKNSAPSRDPS